MDVTLELARSKSAYCFDHNDEGSSQLTYVLRNQVPDWAKDQEAKKVQKRVWDDVAKELDSIQPGCVRKIV